MTEPEETPRHEWELHARIRTRSHNRCERCGCRNWSLGAWRDGRFHPAQPLGESGLRLQWPKPGQRAWCGASGFEHFLTVTRVICEIVHVDHEGIPCGSLDCLLFLCRRCQHAMQKREADRIARAAGDLFAEVS